MKWQSIPLQWFLALPLLPVQMESGGTVLSTNWRDVGKRKVDVSPPDDVELKKYWTPPSPLSPLCWPYCFSTFPIKNYGRSFRNSTVSVLICASVQGDAIVPSVTTPNHTWPPVCNSWQPAVDLTPLLYRLIYIIWFFFLRSMNSGLDSNVTDRSKMIHFNFQIWF